MNNQENLLGVIHTILKWKKRILLLCLIAGVLSIIIALCLSNYYQAATTFYAASSDMSSPKKVFGGSSYGLSYFGNDNDNDRLQTIANSAEIKNYLINKYNLTEHYGIDTSDNKGKYRVYTTFAKLYDVKKTKFEAIELSIEDKDPILASQMTNDARDKVDEVHNSLIKKSQKVVLETLEENINNKEILLRTLGDTLVNLRRIYGIYNIDTQSELLAELVASAETKLSGEKARYDELASNPMIPRDTLAYIKAEIKGFEQELNGLTMPESENNFNLKRFNDGMAFVEVLTQKHAQSRVQLSYDLERYNQLLSAYNSTFSSIHVMEKAAVPLIKSRPKRSILVLSAVFVTFLFVTAGILIFESFQPEPTEA